MESESFLPFSDAYWMLYIFFLADPHLTISAKNMDETIDSKELRKFVNGSHFLM